MSIQNKHIKEFIATAHRVAEYGLVSCGSGNLSCRVENDCLLIKTTNSWMADLSPEQIAVCRIADIVTLNGKKPSKEIGFHAGILRKRPDVNVVLHFQSPCATTLACCQPEVKNFFVIPEIPYYLGPVAVIPYLPPGSRELADAVVSAMANHELVILRNHGQVVVGESFDRVIERATYFELACKIILGAGANVRLLSKEAIADQYQKGKASRSKGR